MSPLQLIDELRWHLNGSIDEIPMEIVSGARNETGNGPKYKAQTNWFQNVSGTLEYALIHKLITGEELHNRVGTFIDYLCSDAFRGRPGRPTQRADIDTANRIITEVIANIAETLDA